MTHTVFPVSDALVHRASAGLRAARAVDADGRAALLLFTLGPVQDFIAAARRTSDLRAGSFLLSTLAAAALRVVYDRVGRDAVFFPDLGSEPELLAAWQAGETKPPPHLALPNRFLAAVPNAEAGTLAEAAKKAACQALREAVAFAQRAFAGRGSTWGWHEADHFLECAWAAHPFAEGDDYGAAYRTLEQAVGGVKALRRFDQVESTGFRGSLVPTMGALVPRREAAQKEVDGFWKQKQDRGRLRLRVGEQLSAISITKRLFAEHIGRNGQDLFPSTASFAVADYKRAVLRALPGDAGLRDELERFLQAAALLGDLDEVRYTKEPPLPLLDRLAETSGVGTVARQFAALPGDWLFDDFLTRFSFERAFDVTLKDEDLLPAREALLALLRATDRAGIARPSRYYGLIVFDGDHMGRWLSGEKTDGITPETHLAISEALGCFARRLVPHLVERQYLGRLVYSGGDDVLAFVSFEDALPLLHALRAAFSGQVVPDGDAYRVDWTRTDGTVLVDGQPCPTLGPTAEASAGLVLAHQQEPLQDVVQLGRQAEKAAKDGGRNRFALALGRRSGGRFTAVAPWQLPGGATGLLPVIERLASAVRDRRLSSSFLYDAQRDADVLAVLPDQAVAAELRRLFGRRTEGVTDEAEAERFWSETLAPILDASRNEEGRLVPSDALTLVHAAVLFGQGGDRQR